MWQPTRSMLAGFVAQDQLQKLDNAPWVSNYATGIADAGGVVDNVRYAAMISSPSVQGVFYNKDVFKKAGINELPKNWDELVETAQKVKSTKAADSAFFEAGGSQWTTQYAVSVQLADAAKKGEVHRQHRADGR